MRTCGIFSVQGYDVPMPRASDRVRLIPFGDVHRDSDAHAEKDWRAFLKYAARQKDAFFLGMGDYLDGFSTSERAILAHDGLHETSRRRFERESMAWIHKLAGELSPLAPRMIGLLGGNHYPTFADGTTGDQRLASALGCRFLGCAAAIRLSVRQCHTIFGCDIFAHHGRGSARTVGGGLMGVQRLMDVCEADIYLMGDDHKAAVSPVGERLRIAGGQGGIPLCIRARSPIVGRTGSFTRGYEPGLASYVADAALPPTTLGWIEISIRIVREGPAASRRRRLVVEGTTRICA